MDGEARVTRRLWVALFVVACVTGLTASATAGAAPAAKAPAHAPKLADPDAKAKELLTTWLTALQQGDTATIAKLLAPNFQIERADGTGTDRAGYLANPAKVTSFAFADELVALQHGDTLTVRWGLKITEQIGGTQYVDQTAPRLTAFVWRQGRWQILAYGNFNPVVPTK